MYFTREQVPALQSHFMQPIPKMTLTWQFTVPPPHLIDTPLQLLTIAGVSIPGYWQGDLGEYFVAWAPITDFMIGLYRPTIQ